MASVAQTIAMRGVRFAPTLLPATRPRGVRVTVAAGRAHDRLADGRRGGLRHRHGGGAAGRKVAGKTGTAELEDTRDPETGETAPPDPSNTDAWFTAYAPVEAPEDRGRRDAGASGAGGATAAPAARVVLDAATP